jgi:hypothetical protein
MPAQRPFFWLLATIGNRQLFNPHPKNLASKTLTVGALYKYIRIYLYTIVAQDNVQCILLGFKIKAKGLRGQGERVSQMLVSRIPLAAERKPGKSSVNLCLSVAKNLCRYMIKMFIVLLTNQKDYGLICVLGALCG